MVGVSRVLAAQAFTHGRLAVRVLRAQEQAAHLAPRHARGVVHVAVRALHEALRHHGQRRARAGGGGGKRRVFAVDLGPRLADQRAAGSLRRRRRRW